MFTLYNELIESQWHIQLFLKPRDTLFVFSGRCKLMSCIVLPCCAMACTYRINLTWKWFKDLNYTGLKCYLLLMYEIYMYLIGINYDNIWNFEKKKQASPWQEVVSVKTIIYAYLRWMMAVHFDNNHRYFTNVFWEHLVISILVDDRPKHKIWCILYTKKKHVIISKGSLSMPHKKSVGLFCNQHM